MSKRHGARKARKKRALKRARAKTPAALLAAVADVLNACERRGMRMRPGYGGAIFSRHGILLPPVEKGQGWLARPLPPRPDALFPADHDDD